MSAHFEAYARKLQPDDLVVQVTATKDKFNQRILEPYDYASDHQVLLYGDVQSGKTSHMLGVVAHCLDEGFRTVVVLTSPNVRLVSQTYERIAASLDNVQVCRSDMTNEFRENQEKTTPMQSVVVLGKIPRVLDSWLRVFRETNALSGHPVLIVDDEADATSLNTKVNKEDISRINSQLDEIRCGATGCIYLQVTGTPQAILLQSEVSGWAIDDAIHFMPGSSYVGGDLFFGNYPNNYTRTFSESTLDEEINLTAAVRTHMVTCAMFKISGRSGCNMMLHPSHRTPIHSSYEKHVKGIVAGMFDNWGTAEVKNSLRGVYDQLLTTFPDAPPLAEVISTLAAMQPEFRFLIINAKESTEEEDWADGYNFIVGGNSLGRGLTFSYLQTVFYVRESRRPQADTVWQHARMFGYARHTPTLRCFLPATLAKMFQEVHQGNEIIKQQLEAGVDVRDLRVVLGGNIRPTRVNVLDATKVRALTGGVNYFASDPVINKFDELDAKLTALVSRHGDDMELSPKAVSKLTQYFKTEAEDLDLATFRLALDDLSKNHPHMTARVIVRTRRKVNHGTGVLLSPNDQQLSRQENKRPLLILYRIDGVNAVAKARGASTWSSDPIWVPNIKLPGGRQYWRVK